MKIKILKEDKNYLVFDKPAGMVVHGDGKEAKKQETVSDYILKNFKKIKGVGEDLVVSSGQKEVVVPKPGIVHRLDKETSGCLLIAKNNQAYESFKKQFQGREIKKEYVALVWGHLKQETGLIDLAIARSKNDFRKKEVVRVKVQGVEEAFRGEERASVTRYKVMKRLELFGQKLSLVAYYPETGRMHQIRIHTKSIGHPIVFDYLYGPKGKMHLEFEKKYFKNIKTSPRHMLHARTLTFHDPVSHALVKVEAPLPKIFDQVIKAK